MPSVILNTAPCTLPQNCLEIQRLTDLSWLVMVLSSDWTISFWGRGSVKRQYHAFQQAIGYDHIHPTLTLIKHTVHQ